MTGGGAAGVGKGLGMGLTEALAASRIAKEDVQQGKAMQADPRLMQIYETIGMPGQPS
jgi:hypothetical protein